MRCGLSIEEFWRLTPREVQLVMRASSGRRMDAIDEQITGAWHAALWGGVQRVRKLPELRDVIGRRRRVSKRRRMTLEEDVRRWEIFFKSATKAN